MLQNKLLDASSAPSEFNDTDRNYVAIDFSKISLTTIIQCLADFTLICIALSAEFPPMTKFLLLGAQKVLLKTETVAYVLVVMTALLKLQIGPIKFISQGSGSNSARSFTVAAVLTFINGSLDVYVSQVAIKEMMSSLKV